MTHTAGAAVIKATIWRRRAVWRRYQWIQGVSGIVGNSQTWRGADGSGRADGYIFRALDHSRICITVQDGNGIYVLVANLPDCWTVGENATPDDISIFGAEIAAKLGELKSTLRANGDNRTHEFAVGAVGKERLFQFRIEAMGDADSGTDLVTTIIDLSEERRRERLLRSLLREVSHRSKNLLAIVQSIASQTARDRLSVASFLDRFRGRIQSLAFSQDLITDSDWRGAYLRELVTSQVSKLTDKPEAFLVFDGSNPRLTPNAALHVGLAIHELAVNAAARGRSRRRDGPVRLECRSGRSGDGHTVELAWSERYLGSQQSQATDSPARDFGSTVLEMIAPRAVGGDASYTESENEVSYRLQFPLAEPDAAAGSGSTAARRAVSDMN